MTSTTSCQMSTAGQRSHNHKKWKSYTIRVDCILALVSTGHPWKIMKKVGEWQWIIKWHAGGRFPHAAPMTSLVNSWESGHPRGWVDHENQPLPDHGLGGLAPFLGNANDGPCADNIGHTNAYSVITNIGWSFAETNISVYTINIGVQPGCGKKRICL